MVNSDYQVVNMVHDEDRNDDVDNIILFDLIHRLEEDNSFFKTIARMINITFIIIGIIFIIILIMGTKNFTCLCFLVSAFFTFAALHTFLMYILNSSTLIWTET